MFQYMLVAWACLVARAVAQPTACVDDSQCSSGYYCLTDAHYCHQCLRCEDLGREPPRTPNSCITSIVDCGPCLKGLVDDRLGESNAGCGAVGSDAGEGLPGSVWALIALGLLLLVAVLIGLIYVLRHTDTFKVLASTRTSVQTPAVAAAGSGPCPSPSAPPPYNLASYEPVRTSSPSLPPATYEPESPLVKRAPRESVGGAREAAGSQSARVYSNPAYVRNAQPPPSYAAALSEESEDAAGFTPLDEDTVESVWTPQHSSETATVAVTAVSAGAGAGAGAGGAGGGAGEARPPPAKLPRRAEDSNNNDNSSSSRGAPSFVINVLNVNSMGS